MSIVKLLPIYKWQVSLFGLFFLALTGLQAQCPEEGGLVCHPDSLFGSPILCDLDCLDGFEATIKDTIFGVDQQPDFLCSNGGSADNISWFAFVAGDTTISLTLFPSNCNEILDDEGKLLYSAVQAGIFSSCDFSEANLITCYNPCGTSGGGMSPEDITLESNSFIPGQTYYFYVDGCGGTVCDYRIEVNEGKQPFDIFNPSDIVSSALSDGDTICTGHVDVSFAFDSISPGVMYYWEITPPISDMPDEDLDGWGTFPSISSSEISVTLDIAGEFTLRAYATNDCDQSDTVLMNFVVEDLPNVVFDSVAICGEDFGTYPGPFQMINGQNIGWMSGFISMPGWNTGIVTQVPSGCTYEEAVYVERLPTPMGRDTVIACAGDFPFDFLGNTINSAADAGLYAAGSGQNGCDSMVQLHIFEASADAQIDVVRCEMNSVTLAVVVDGVNSEYDSLAYGWRDINGEVTDSDGIDSLLQVSQSATYFVDITIFRSGGSCMSQAASFVLNMDDLRPAAPSFISPIVELCEGEMNTPYAIATSGSENSIHWYLDGDDDITFADDQNITVDWTMTDARRLCAYVEGDCGISDTVCVDISLLPIPEVSFESADSACVDEELAVVYTGQSGVNLAWNTDGGTLVTDANPNFGIQWNAAGRYEIELSGQLNGCSDTLVTKKIVVTEMLPPLTLTCAPVVGGIAVSWSTADCVSEYILDTSGVEVYRGTANSFTLDGLASGQRVDMRLRTENNCPCGGLPVSITSCQAEDCPAITLSIEGMAGFVCADDLMEVVEYSVNITGGSSQGQGTWSGEHISPSGVFDQSMSPTGKHTFVYTYEEAGCTFVDSTSIIVQDNPELTIEIEDPACYDEETGTVDVSATGGSGAYTFFVNGTVTSDLNDIQLGAGDYSVSVVDDQNCGDSEVFEIEIPGEPDLQIVGSGDIVEGNSGSIAINTSAFLDHVIDSILWKNGDGTTICLSPDCEEVMVSPTNSTSYFVTVYFDGGCSVTQSYMLAVRPETAVAVPNVLSPNGVTSANRVFSIGSNLDDLLVERFAIYNRWGEQVYLGENFTIQETEKFWDGKYKGQLAQAGIYVYYLEATDGEKKIVRKGDLMLLR